MKVCFTGHRTIKGEYSPRGHWPAVYARTVQLVSALAKTGYTEFISGGALGFDQIAAHAVIAHKTAGWQVDLTMALPFPGFEGKWRPESKSELKVIVNQATTMLYVNEGNYAPWKMQKRNEWMVDNAVLVIALYGPDKPGGTLNCLNYTMAQI